MKRLVVLPILIILLLCGCISSQNTDLWNDAIYKEDTTLGNGNTCLTLNLIVEKKEITFTIYTDKSTVGEALIECELIEGETSEYGMYIKKVNNIYADYSKSNAYWAFYINESYANSGVDSTQIEQGAIYTLEYTK